MNHELALAVCPRPLYDCADARCATENGGRAASTFFWVESEQRWVCESCIDRKGWAYGCRLDRFLRGRIDVAAANVDGFAVEFKHLQDLIGGP